MPTITPFNSGYRQDIDPPVALSVTGTSFNPLWEAIGSGERAGKFSARARSASVTLTPLNRTQKVDIKVFDAKIPSWTGASSGLTVSGETISLPGSVTPATFYGVMGNESCPVGDDCFIEAIASGHMAARSVGLSRLTTPSPTYAWNDPGYDFALAIGQIGLYSIWVAGEPIFGVNPENPVGHYQEGDTFRVAVENGKVCFRQNGKLVYKHEGAVPDNLYPVVSFYDLETELTGIRFWQQDYGQAYAPLWTYAVLPVCQDKVTEHEVTEAAEVSEAEGMRGRDKVVRYHKQIDKWDLIYSGRRLSELQTMREFRRFHRIHIPFIMSDQARGIEMFVVFDTGIKDRLIQANMFDFSCTVKQYE